MIAVEGQRPVHALNDDLTDDFVILARIVGHLQPNLMGPFGREGVFHDVLHLGAVGSCEDDRIRSIAEAPQALDQSGGQPRRH